MKLIYKLFVFVLVICSSPIFTQNQHVIDSIHNVIDNATHDSTRITNYLELCIVEDIKYAETILPLVNKLLAETNDAKLRKKYFQQKAEAYSWNAVKYERIQKDVSKELFFLEKVLSTNIEAKDTLGITNAIIGIADYYTRNGNALKRLEALQNGFKKWDHLNYNIGKSKFVYLISVLFADQGDTLQALNYLEKGIELENKIGDPKRLPKSYFELGLFYARLNYNDKAITYYLKSIEKYNLSNQKKFIPEIYLKLGQAMQANGDLKKASETFEVGYKLAEELKDSRVAFFLMIAIGSLDEQMGNYQKAIDQHQKTYVISRRLNKNYIAEWLSCSALAKDYIALKNYEKAKLFSHEALTAIKKGANIKEIFEAEKLVYKIDSIRHDFASAYIHYYEFIKLGNQLNDENVKKFIAREKFQSDLESQKKQAIAEQERKDVVNEKENKNKNSIIIGVSVILLIVLALTLLIFRGLKQNQKINKELIIKNKIIEKQKYDVEHKHQEITDSINYAERIQRSFLATKSQLDENLKDYFIMFQPKDVVSGDFYWAHTLKNGNFALVTADSTGHGVPGAIMCLLNTSSLEKAVELGISEPAEILNHTRKTIIDRLKKDGSIEGGKDGMDCSLISIDPSKTKLTYSAANNPIWIIRDNKIIELIANKMPVGKHDHDSVSFTQHEIELQKGDLIYTLTDGFPDQFGGPKGKKFMYKKLKEFLINISQLPMKEQKEQLEIAFKNWKGDLEQVDDVCLIGIRV
jgi:serine phosphatase RsbU (regulator of sigma subunit)